jgi:hypothetical protein
MGIKVTNFGASTLQLGIDAVALSLTVTSGTGARFPALGAGDYFYAVLQDISNNVEIIKVTARATDTFTIVRAQEGTTAKVWAGGSAIELRPTAQTIADLSVEQCAPSVATALGHSNTASTHAATATTQASTATTQAGIATTQAGTATTQAGIATTQAGNATTQATNSANSATAAQGYLAPATATSTTSLTVATGTQSPTVTTGKPFVAGHPIKIARTSDPINTYMTGTITSYNSGTGALVANITTIAGTGTFTDWTCSLTISASPTWAQVTSKPAALNTSNILMGDGAGGISSATAGTHYQAAQAVTGIVLSSGTTRSAATAGTHYVAPGGALGTPSSGVLTNCTGTAAGLTAGNATAAAKATYAEKVPAGTSTTTLLSTDAGKCVVLGAGITIPSGAGFNGTEIVSLYNGTSGNLTLTKGAGLTLWKAGTATNAATYTLAQRGVATIWYVSSTEAVISGAGVT